MKSDTWIELTLPAMIALISLLVADVLIDTTSEGSVIARDLIALGLGAAIGTVLAYWRHDIMKRSGGR